ncbi:MAG TPA: FtsK/SpoIIIE domain-containing protein [Arthrobacter sp.]|nr:FtsK/SpoIIIE domain-containing protein [Arthrobacter sp.]
MTLHCTLVRSPHALQAGPPLELSITAPPGTSGANIHARLVEKFSTGAVFVGRDDLCSMSFGTAPLVNGAVLVDGGNQPTSRKNQRRPVPDPAAPIALAVHTGAGAGILVPLRRGTYTIGRSNTSIVVSDPELSREHARLVVTEKDIMIFDLHSANGTYVDGGKVRHAVVTTDSTIRCGNTAMSLVFLDLPDKALADAGTSVKEPLTIEGRSESGNRGILLLTALLPLAIGIGLAVLTGMWMFLAFAAVSAASLLLPLAAGRRQGKEYGQRIKVAVEEDRKRRQRAGPSLPVLVLAARNGQAAASPAEGDSRVWLRLGQARQEANLKVALGTAPHIYPSAGEVPVLLDPDPLNTTFRGSRTVAEAMIRSLVMQLAGYPRGSRTRIIICGPLERLPLPARFLPSVTLAGSPEAGLGALADGYGSLYDHGVLLSTEASPLDDGGLRNEAARLGWQVLQFCAPDAAPGISDVELAERQSLLREAGRHIAFVPDLAPEDVFSNFCRQMAASPLLLDGQEPRVPAACTLAELLPLSAADTAARWNASVRTHGLGAPLGLGATGPQYLDLQSDGPHLLVAGTTGSGKSELLRTLVLALALSHPPDRVNFLFVDFKGGSGLGPLAGLVHCVGVLTDLATHELERTLASLRAEIRVREEALAAAQVPDLAAYRSTRAFRIRPLPHLVIVIDEFRMLVDDAPEALRELMRIASIGRSLGLHLVMATQRPQGALTADIRANVTSSIALRVQSETESHDIIRTAAAAAIRLDTPGRALVARGMEEPQEFQAASTGGACRAPAFEDIEVQLASEYLAALGVDTAATAGTADPTPAGAAAPLVAMVRGLWASQAGAAPRRPVAPPLPQQLTRPEPAMYPAEASAVERAGNGADQWTIDLGMVDLPDRQEVKPLVWDPKKDSHLALIGGPASGAAEALDMAAREVGGHPTESHCYFLDAGGTFLHLAAHPRTGAHAGLHELRRAVRILERLAQELAGRLSLADRRVPLVLVISGWGSWVSAFRAGPLAWAEDIVQDLVRDGARAGITVLISGDRELVTARFCGSLPNRVYFPTGSSEESRIAWPKMPSTAAAKGRGVAFGSVVGGTAAVCQLYEPSSRCSGHDGPSRSDVVTAGTRPFRVEPLPSLVSVAEVRALAARNDDVGLSVAEAPAPVASGEVPGPRRGPGEVRLLDLLLGVGGDELRPVTVRIPAGSVFAVLGGPGSGKTNVLRALQALNPTANQWTCPDGCIDPVEFWKNSLLRAKARELPREAVLLADDVDLLHAEALRDLSELHALGHAVVLTANYSPLLLQRVPLVMDSRAAGKGLLLSPRSPSEGDLFGVRFDIETNPPAGRGIVISRGRSSPVQVAWAGTE